MYNLTEAEEQLMMQNMMPDNWTDAVRKRVGQNIRRKRKESGWTIRRFAVQFGVDFQSVHRWEHGINIPRLDLLLWMCKCCGWKLSDILGGQNDRGQGIQVQSPGKGGSPDQ